MSRLLPAFLAAASLFGQDGKLLISGSFRSRLEMWDWFEASSGTNRYAYFGNLLRVGVGQQNKSWDWRAEFAVPLLGGLPDNPLAPGAAGALGLGANYLTANQRNRNPVMVFPKEVYLRFKANSVGKFNTLQIGRFEFLDGSEIVPKNATLAAVKRDRVNQRLLGNFGWAHVQRSFDGVRFSHSRPSGDFTFVGAVPTRGVFQVDGWGWNKTAFQYAAFTRPWGKGNHAADTRLFGLYYHDWRPIPKTDNRPAAARTADLASVRTATFGGHTLHAVTTKSGTADFLLWGAAQTGRWGNLDHRAGAIDIEAGFQPKACPKVKPWFRGGFYWGSGDGNPNDATHNTFFQVLPTPRPFARTPFFNMMNNRDIFGMMILRPHPQITVSSEFHGLSLANRNDLWYQGGGVFQPWTFGYVGRNAGGARSLANLYDTSVDYRPNPKVQFTVYYGFLQGLAAPAAIYPRGKAGQFAYVEVMYRF